MPRKVYAAFIDGQFSQVGSSLGMRHMADAARMQGIIAEEFADEERDRIFQAIEAHRSKVDVISTIGFSLGAGTAEALNTMTRIDLLIALDPSRLGYNYKINRANTG